MGFFFGFDVKKNTPGMWATSKMNSNSYNAFPGNYIKNDGDVNIIFECLNIIYI